MKISIVTTLYYSRNFIHPFYQKLKLALSKITDDYEIIFINDGSPDDSIDLVLTLKKQDDKIVIIDLTKNFGHHNAIYTGLKYSRGEFVFLIDVDLEEDPLLLNEFWDFHLSNQEIEVIYGVQKSRKGKAFERISGQLYYYFFRKISEIDYPSNTLTARLMSRSFVNSVLLFNEKDMDIWCTFVLAGYKQKGLVVSKGSKESTTYSLSKKIKMLLTSITSASSKPLEYIFYLGSFITAVSFLFIVYLLISKMIYKDYVLEGWTSVVITLWFIGGILIFCIGIIGIYLSKVFNEVKNRPHSIIKNIYN